MTEDTREPGFYWVLPVLDVDVEGPDGWCTSHWHNQDQPAYWDGQRWYTMHCDYPDDWGIRWVGDQITEKAK